jgi:hypothetical protein
VSMIATVPARDVHKVAALGRRAVDRHS